MEVKTIIAIPARGSHPVKRTQAINGKRRTITMDKDRLQKLSDQLTSLVEELDDIREDLSEMYSELEESNFTEENEPELVDQMEEICETVSSAYEELNEALDEMEDLI